MKQANSFDKIAKEYDYSRVSIPKLPPLYIKKLMEILKIEKFSNICEIGTGTGKNLSLFSDYAEKIIGLDISLEMLKKADKNKIYLINADALNLPLKEKKFDLIIHRNFIHLVSFYKEFLFNVKKLLKPSGFFLHIFVAQTPLDGFLFSGNIIKEYRDELKKRNYNVESKGPLDNLILLDYIKTISGKIEKIQSQDFKYIRTFNINLIFKELELKLYSWNVNVKDNDNLEIINKLKKKYKDKKIIGQQVEFIFYKIVFEKERE